MAFSKVTQPAAAHPHVPVTKPFDKIAKGEATSVRDIARVEGMDEGDVSRFLPLAFLAPDIVEAILAGRQPTELTAEKLKRLRFLPPAWEDQRQLLGFAG